MTKPTHCGKPARPYRKVHGYHQAFGPAWEEGFRCRVCPAIRLPTNPPLDPTYMLAMPAVRDQGIAWDDWLRQEHLKAH